MQLFLITPFIMMAYCWRRWFGYLIIIALIALNVVYSFSITMAKNIPSSPVLVFVNQDV